MINDLSIQSVKESCFSKSFTKPLYGSFCFSKIPATIKTLLTGKEKELALPSSCFLEDSYDLVILFVLDGLAWNAFERYSNHPFFQRFIQKGIVSKTTAQFPSTTAAELTTLHTGLEVGQTGIYEWFQYEPKVDRIIAPLLFSYAGDTVEESLRATKISPVEFFPFKTIYQKLHEEKIASHLFHPVGISPTPYSQTIGRGAHVHSYFNFTQGLKSASEFISQEKQEKNYLFFYFPDIDSVGHRQGVDSKQHEQTILSCLDLLEKEFMEKTVFESKKISLLVTSDHGMGSIHPKKTIYLNRELPKISSYLKSGAQEKLLTPAGSCRDYFLHAKEECIDELVFSLNSLLQGKAETWKVSDLMNEGLFGENPPSSRFLERVGNIAILPFEGESVWWYEKNRFEQHFYGAHGGLTRNEMETPFLFLAL